MKYRAIAQALSDFKDYHPEKPEPRCELWKNELTITTEGATSCYRWDGHEWEELPTVQSMILLLEFDLPDMARPYVPSIMGELHTYDTLRKKHPRLFATSGHRWVHTDQRIDGKRDTLSIDEALGALLHSPMSVVESGNLSLRNFNRNLWLQLDHLAARCRRLHGPDAVPDYSKLTTRQYQEQLLTLCGVVDRTWGDD